MKKTIIVATIAAVVSTGAFAKPASHNAPKSHNAHTPVHSISHNAKPAVHAHTGHHNPTPYVASVRRPTPPPPPHHHHHHHHNGLDLGDALIAIAILATAM